MSYRHFHDLQLSRGFMTMQNSLILLSLLFHKAENIGRSEVLEKTLLFALASKRVGRVRKTFDQLGVA